MSFMNASLKPGHEKERAAQFFKSYSVDSMYKGKLILYNISFAPFTSLNAFLIAAGETPVDEGGYWGWKNLYWELLSNKYGVAAIYDQKTKKTKFIFRLPPVEDIHEEVEEEINRLEQEKKNIEAKQKQQEEITKMMKDITYIPSC